MSSKIEWFSQVNDAARKCHLWNLKFSPFSVRSSKRLRRSDIAPSSSASRRSTGASSRSRGPPPTRPSRSSSNFRDDDSPVRLWLINSDKVSNLQWFSKSTRHESVISLSLKPEIWVAWRALAAYFPLLRGVERPKRRHKNRKCRLPTTGSLIFFLCE